MTSTTLNLVARQRPKQIAPTWHTALFACFFVALAIAGAVFQSHAKAHPHELEQHRHMVPVYLSIIAMEAGLFFYVKGGLNRYQVPIQDVIRGDWSGAKSILRDVGIGLGAWLVWLAISSMWNKFLGADPSISIYALPRRPLDVLLVIAVSISAGISEEFAFRGYLQRQFGALTGSRWLGLVLQAVVFGIAHAYEGTRAAMQIVLFGLLFGFVAFWRKSLCAGMIGHAWADIMSGLFGI
jgi:membrane protease YdiL (CAAX protease family)